MPTKDKRKTTTDQDTLQESSTGRLAALAGVIGTSLLLAGLAALAAFARRRQPERRQIPRALALPALAIPVSATLVALFGLADAGRRQRLVDAAGDAAGVVMDAARQVVDRTDGSSSPNGTDATTSGHMPTPDVAPRSLEGVSA